MTLAQSGEAVAMRYDEIDKAPMPLYWGPQPFTAGPMYMGAISIFLFVLGLILCRGREKWWILAATVIAVLLSWGNHFMWFTKLWFDYAPLYNKFRTVSMALIVLQVTVPMLGFYILDRVMKEKYSRKDFLKAGGIAWAVTAGFCLISAIMPGVAGTFTGSVDAGQPDVLVDALVADRQDIMIKDAWRSCAFITIIFALLFWAFQTPKIDAVGPQGSFVRKGRMMITGAAVVLLVFLDLVPVGKRYLNKEHFVTPKDFSAAYDPRPVDEILFEDEDPDFRVLDISVNTFNDAITSYHHKTIGGYSPVKMQRYQDLIDRYITKEIRQLYDVVGNGLKHRRVGTVKLERSIGNALHCLDDTHHHFLFVNIGQTDVYVEDMHTLFLLIYTFVENIVYIPFDKRLFKAFFARRIDSFADKYR